MYILYRVKMPTFTVDIQQFPVVETTYISLDISHYYIYKTFSHINVFKKKKLRKTDSTKEM